MLHLLKRIQYNRIQEKEKEKYPVKRGMTWREAGKKRKNKRKNKKAEEEEDQYEEEGRRRKKW